ncbi:cytochrome C oxidase [Flavobacterium psychrophilum]|nr:cytochrome C oxidase [Flavobacterium psychrophilum]
MNYSITSNELSGNKKANDAKGLLKNISSETNYRFFASKRPAIKRPKIDPELTKLVLWFLGTAVFWLLIGSSIGEYVGIKFIAPDADTYSWLSIGRLRAVHTNLVFWAWSTIGIMGLGYYIVPMVSNTPLNNIKNGWKALIAVNLAMFVGAITLMAGINNAGGEYREIIWPIMAVWAYGLLLTVTNFIKTIAKRTTHEIYISNWFIIASYIFILIVAFLSYIPMGQDGIGETIVQGYYMHQAVGMWFMFSMLGILYYILPQQVNKPIYSYSLGVLAFWSQILFYTTIGTHHFVFSSLPWWLQTVAIIGSVGMLIPVTSGTINYLMTFKGSWSKVSNSYSLPFLLVGVVYYFTGSFQGTAEAFRSTNLIWHFYRFYHCPFAYNNVWHYNFSIIWKYLCYRTKTYRTRTTTTRGWSTFLVGINRITILHHTTNDWWHTKRINVGRRKTIYRQCSYDGTLLALESNWRFINVAFSYCISV